MRSPTEMDLLAGALTLYKFFDMIASSARIWPYCMHVCLAVLLARSASSRRQKYGAMVVAAYSDASLEQCLDGRRPIGRGMRSGRTRCATPDSWRQRISFRSQKNPANKWSSDDNEGVGRNNVRALCIHSLLAAKQIFKHLYLGKALETLTSV